MFDIEGLIGVAGHRAKPLRAVVFAWRLCQLSLMTVRTATADDYDLLGHVMFRAIHEGASPYSEAQRVAWMPKANSGSAWASRLEATCVVVAEQNGAIAGFMNIDGDGYIDLAFLLPAARGTGLFGEMLSAVTRHAVAQNLCELRTHASLMAQPAFARFGFVVTEHECVTRGGEHLQRAAMWKSLL